MPTFGERYRGIRQGQKERMAQLSKAAPRAVMGHPDYNALPFGTTEAGQNVIFIIDIRGFTKITIAHDNAEAFQIIWAITDATLESVGDYGGYIGEFTGDGVMAYFGTKTSEPDQDIFDGLRAAAGLIGDIKLTISEDLEKELAATVRVGIGIEAGDVLWGRLGTPFASDVKPVSDISFIAGKNSSAASRHPRSWQVLLGEKIARAVPAEYLEAFDPYAFEYRGTRYSYGRSLLKWEAFHRDFCRNESALKERIFKQLRPATSTVVTPRQNISEPKRFACSSLT